MTVNTEARELAEATAFLKARTPTEPKLALILGSGLGNFAAEITNPVTIEAKQIPHYPASTVEGHSGRLIIGSISLNGITSPPLLLFQGRTHYYESGSIHPITFPVRVAKELGVTHLILTNAAGGINRAFLPGQFMLISDLLSLTFLPDRITIGSEREQNPVLADRYGTTPLPPFQFDPAMNDLFRTSARSLRIRLAEGVYCWLKGPSYETPAEIEMLARCGVDAVGMSTVPELVEAHRLGMSVAGISLISNLAAGLSDARLSHHEVRTIADRVQVNFTALMKEVMVRLGPLLGREKAGTASNR